MHVFITGVAGFLGSNLADFYLKKGFKVSGNDNLIGGSISNINSKLNFYNYDCEDFQNNIKLYKDVDILIHAAAFAHEGLSVFSPYLITRNIVAASSSVFSAAIQCKVSRIIYCSSMARYGNIAQPYLENSVANPVDPYGIAKLASEKILKNLCETHSIDYNIAIPHNIIGPKQKINDPFRNVVGIMMNRIMQGKRPIIYGDGNQTRCFTDIDDCIYCIDQLAFSKNIKSEIFNIGPDENPISINILFEKIANLMKFNEKPLYFKDRPNEIKTSNCSAEKSRKLLNYKTRVNLDESLKKMLDYVKKIGPQPFQYSYEIEINNDLTPITWTNKLI